MPHRPRACAATLAMLLIVAGCTGDPPPTPAPTLVNVPTLPADQFPGLPDRADGVSVTVDALAGDNKSLVMVATVNGRSSTPLLRSSDDGGRTWQDGRLSDEAAAASAVGEETVGVAAVARIGGGRRWLALGTDDDAPIAWTSEDATTWQRSAVTGLRPRTDQVTSVTGMTGGGFVAVGYAWKDSVQWPRVWTSSDGVAWTVHKLSGQGWLTDVAVSGDDLVAVGARSLPELKNGRSQYSLLFTSSDRGAGWQRHRVQEPRTSGHFVSHLETVVATTTGFMVGGSYYDDFQNTYRALLLRTGDLATWFEAPALPDPGRSSGVSELVQAGATTWAALESTTAQGRDQVTVMSLGDDALAWRSEDSPVSNDDVEAVAGAAAGGSAVIAVSVDQKADHTDVWPLTANGSIAEVEVTAPTRTAVNVQPSGLFLVNGALAAYGTSQGADVWWAATAQGFQKPIPIRDVAGQSVSQVTWSAGGFLALADRGDDAFVLHSANGQQWRATSRSTFNRVAQYHWASLDDVTWAHDRWVVVGDRSTNGDIRLSALVSTSTDGRRWTAGRPTRVTARGDWWGRRSPLDDLHGLNNHARSMSSVAGLAKGMVAVGSFDSKQRTRPAAWVSADNVAWRLVPLPAAGYADARPEQVTVVGSTIVALGWGRPAGSTRLHRVVWRSTTGGRSWTIAPVEQWYRSSLLAGSDQEFLQVVLEDDRRTVTLLRSVDGQAWTSSTVRIDGLTDGMEVGLFDAVVTDTGLHLLLNLQNRLDSVRVVQTVPL